MKHAVAAAIATPPAAPAELPEMWYNDPHLWVAVAFVVFALIFLKVVLPIITKGLDQRAATIRDQLERANHLRAEAEALLATYKRQQEEAAKEAEALVAQAKKDAETLRANAEAELKQTLARRTKQAEENIQRAEADAVRQIRTQLVNIATETARNVISAQLKGEKEDQAVARAVQSIERNIH